MTLVDLRGNFKNLQEAADHAVQLIGKFIQVNTIYVSVFSNPFSTKVLSAFHREKVLFAPGIEFASDYGY
jgi:hypothetical protein